MTSTCRSPTTAGMYLYQPWASLLLPLRLVPPVMAVNLTLPSRLQCSACLSTLCPHAMGLTCAFPPPRLAALPRAEMLTLRTTSRCPPHISPLECLLQSDDEPFDLRQALLHDGIKDEYDSDTDEEQGDTLPSGPSVFRSFPWPPAPPHSPSDCGSSRHARPPDSGECSGSVW